MIVKGKYYERDGWYNVVVPEENKVYIISKDLSTWGALVVGQYIPNGKIFTQEMFEDFIKNCDKEGEFII